jgi:uncharacterized membrane protein
MNKNRLEAFSDGIIAILITIMVFDIKPPAGSDFAALASVVPIISTYVMSFLYLGIYWNNHHHMFVLVPRINGAVLWANLHLLFWLSFLPFTTNWLRSSGFQTIPAALYGIVLLCAAIAFLILQESLIRIQGPQSPLKQAVGSDIKGKASALIYLLGIGLAFVNPYLSIAMYVFVSLIWLVPDQRIETHFHSQEDQ